MYCAVRVVYINISYAWPEAPRKHPTSASNETPSLIVFCINPIVVYFVNGPKTKFYQFYQFDRACNRRWELNVLIYILWQCSATYIWLIPRWLPALFWLYFLFYLVAILPMGLWIVYKVLFIRLETNFTYGRWKSLMFIRVFFAVFFLVSAGFFCLL